jgi:N-acyl-D-aspartate/D-glutamate deacylase
VFDLLVRGGTVIDGTGSAPFAADVGVRNGTIAAIGPDIGEGAEQVIDASGLAVTPGFIDAHTHYDAQAVWDPNLEPSSAHGVTTVLMGNCGVGFAPVFPSARSWLIELMEGVEDIPGETLRQGITWAWESFPEYLDYLATKKWTMDVATLIPHGAVRPYAMGERGAANEVADPEEIRSMAGLVRSAVEAGAFGFSTSRTMAHTSVDGRPVPGTFAGIAEVRALAKAVVDGGSRLMGVAPAALEGGEAELLADLDMLIDVSKTEEIDVTFLVLQNRPYPKLWKRQLDIAAHANAHGARMVPQIAGRPFGMLVGFSCYHPFLRRPTYRALAEKLPYHELIGELCTPGVRNRILAEDDCPIEPWFDRGSRIMPERIRDNLDNLFALDERVDYEPAPDLSMAARSAEIGVDPMELIYDLCSANDGQGQLLLPLFGFADGDHGALYEMLMAPDTLLGLADGGAHCRTICDASQPTTMLTHWVRDRTRGPRLELSFAVKRLTSEPAHFLGLQDRGVVEVGRRADLNVIDLVDLRLESPRPVDDLPGGGRRILQGARGYVATMVAGQVTRRNGVPTGALPGRLLRS